MSRRYFSTAKERDEARHKGVPFTRRGMAMKAKRDALVKRRKRKDQKRAA